MISRGGQSNVLLSATEEKANVCSNKKERVSSGHRHQQARSFPALCLLSYRKSTSQERIITMSDQHIAHESQAPIWREGASFHEAEIGTTMTARPTRLRQTLRFLLHFGEMVLAMMVGMAIFAVVNSMILIPSGFVYLSASVYPQAYALVMAVSMTVAMVAWMSIRKHPRRLSAEMAGAMLVPTVLLIAICWIAHLPSDVLLTGTHVLMLPAMLAVMLYRWRDYTGH
jgi:hypothetical protein